MTSLVLLLVFLSGFSGLIYQVIWQKYLSAYLGSHALATSQVLACFFLFMALGYFVIGKYQHKLIKNKVFLYGVIEGLIGLYALVSPDYFFWLTKNFSFYSDSLGGELFYSLVLTGLFIGFPTLLMGGTIPVLTQGLVKKYKNSHKIHSWIYSTNTLGAFLGTLMGGFFFIENYGLPMSLLIVGILNILIFVVCYAIWKAKPMEFYGLSESSSNGETQPSLIQLRAWSLYLISFFSGFYVFGLETIIIKIAGISLGSSTYTYSIIVSSFIFAIALGSSLVSFFKKIESARLLFFIQSLLLFSLIGLYYLIPKWPMILNRVDALIRPNVFNFNLKWYFILLFFTFILAIPIGLMGTNLPLLFGYLKQKEEYLSKTVGRLYAVNSIGGFLGALLGGYYFLKWVDLDTAFKSYIILVSSTLLLVVILLTNERIKYYFTTCFALVLIALVFFKFSSNWNPLTFTPGAFLDSTNKSTYSSYWDLYQEKRDTILNQYKLNFSKSGPNTWAVVAQNKLNNDKLLYVNGKPDASTKGDFIVRAMNMLIPISISNEIKDIFIVGLGASLSTGIATLFNEVESVDVAEISTGVVQSMPFFNKDSFNVMDRKSKFKIYQVDAYRKLKSSQKKYNLIVSEPSSLWVSGVELLFSLEFLYEVKSHLKEKGIYTQWFPLFDMDTETFRMILANFNTVFPHVTLWFTSPYTVNIVATKERIEIDENKLKQRFEEQKKVYNKYNIKQYQTILGYQALPEGTAKGLVYDVEKLHSIEWPRLEFLSNKNRYISSVVNLNEFLKLKILKPLPVSNTEFKYLYEDLKNNLEEEFYLHNITRLQQFGRPTDFLHKKMLYNYVNKFKSPQLKLNENILNVLNYYMTGEGSVSLNIESKYKEALKIIDIFKKAMIMHLPVKVENLLELIPVECKEINNCYKIKKYVTHQIFDQKKPSATKITKKDWAKIEEEFKQLKAQ